MFFITLQKYTFLSYKEAVLTTAQGKIIKILLQHRDTGNTKVWHTFINMSKKSEEKCKKGILATTF